ncbi:MAG: triacylglycerol lipase [Marinobacter sp.]|uniref:lipase family alpha/beta hydrolase n=1 Tax=Marinobacter sp. TaxID=50741 RepID=UPI0034A04D72
MKTKVYLGPALALLLVAGAAPAQASLFGWFLSEDTYTETRYPIVLAHGLFGFDDIAGYGYWYRIPEELRRSGAEVYVSQVAAANSTEVRGEELARQVETILAATGAEKVNLMGHSHGGPTSRYVASVYPQYVASVTTIASPTIGGALAADMLQGVTETVPYSGAVLGGMVNAFTGLVDLLSEGGYEQDSLAAMNSLSTSGIAEFGANHPQGVPPTFCGEGKELEDNGVRYYSWSGASPATNILDISDGLMVGNSLMYSLQGLESDGLVGVCSSHLGKVIRDDYRMNHLDEVNQIFGLVSPFGANPVSVFRQHANRLKTKGL